MKEQNQKNIPFLLPCRCHLMCQHLFPLPFILDMMCQKLIKCVITPSFLLLSARLWLGCCCPNLRWARFGRRPMAGAFSSFLPVQNDLLWFSREIYIPTPVK